MGQIPTFDRQDLPQIMRTGPQADIADAGLSWEALARLGDAATDAYLKIRKAENYDWLASNTADFAKKQTDAMEAARKQATQTGDYKGAAQSYIKQLDADQAQRFSNAPSPRTAQAFQLHAKGLRDDLVRSMADFADQGEWKTWQSNTQANLDKLSSASYQNPTLAERNYGIGIGIINGAKAAGIGGDKVDWTQLSDAWGKQNYGAVVRRQVELDPQGALTALRGGKYDFVLHPQDVEAFADQAQHGIDRLQEKELMAQQRAAAVAMRQEAEAQRILRENQAANAATLFAHAMTGSLDTKAVADAVAHQWLTPEAATAAMNAQNGHDDPMAKLHAFQRLGAGQLESDDVTTLLGNRQITPATAVDLQKGINAQSAKGDSTIDRANYETLNTALNGKAVDAGLVDITKNEDNARTAALLTQARGEWTKRVVVNGEDSNAVLADMIPRYTPKVRVPTWLPQPQFGTITSGADIAGVVQQTKAAQAAGTLSPDQYAAQGQLLLDYKKFYDNLANTDAAAAAAAAAAASKARANAPPGGAAQPATLVPAPDGP